MPAAPGSSAGDRDKPHSVDFKAPTDVGAAAAASDPERLTFASPVVSIGAGLVAAASVAALSPLPAAFAASAEHPPVLPTSGALGWLWDGLALALPVGERGLRGEFAVLLLILAVATTSGLLAHRLYRGTGRGAAAFAAVPVSTALLLAWARDPSVMAAAPAALGFTLLATLGLAVFVGAQVRGRGWTPAVWLYGGAATLGAALLWPRVGPAWAALLLAYGGWHAGAGRSWRRGAIALGLALVPIALAYLCASPGFSDSPWTWPWGQELRVGLELGAVSQWTGVALLDLALASLVLLVLPLRWRGGGLLLALVVAGMTVADRSGRLLPAPTLLVLLATAVCGWIWLAGSVRGQRRWLARMGVGVTAVAVVGSAALTFVPVSGPSAPLRPQASLLTLYQRGLIAPGDVLLAHDPWLAATFAAAQRDEGMRPDVEIYAAAAVDPEQLSERLAGWSRAGRRVLSDSFNYAGRWQPAWALDSGPLFWFVGTAGAGDREFTDLREYSPGPATASLTSAEQARWERLHIERARHRRALGFTDEAMLALPFPDETLVALAQRLQMAKVSRLPALAGSELGPGAWSAAPTPASSLAEAGDLLRALGDEVAGSERLAEAATAGVAEAFGALARWQLRAGEDAAARETLAILAAAPVLRPQLLAVCRWLLARTRAEQAAALLADTQLPAGHAAEELGVRLAVLRALAGS